MNARRIRHRAGFSLLELMIAIVILGLGLVMVGTMFPIAWDRARELNEQSISQTVLGVAHDQFTNSIQVTGGSQQTGFTSAHLAGDLLFDPRFNNGMGANIAPADQRVHALNMENMLVALPGNQMPLVGENTWRLERQPGISIEPDGQDFWWDEVFTPYPSPADFINNTFHSARILLHQRVYPPMRARNSINFTVADPAWGTQFATRNFCWSVLYRIHDFGAPEGALAPNGDIIGTPTETAPPWSGSPEWATGPAATAIGREAFHKTRSVDVYYVSLRRPSPTNRYMQQAWTTPREVPNPYAYERPPHLYNVGPAGPMQDVMLPVPWRVQLEFPNNLAMANTATGIPTEVAVPACQEPGLCDDMPEDNSDTGRMLVGMFPTGSRFVDEVNGQVYRVIKRRLISENGDRAMLTLDREVLMEDLDFTDPRTPPAYGSGSRSCDNCETIATQIANNDPPELDVEERIRTVWVFPPPVEPRANAMEPVTYSGPQPVVTIEVRNVLMAPQTTRN